MEIRKPIWGTYVTIRDVVVDGAIKKRKLMRVKITGVGEAIVHPTAWKERAQEASAAGDKNAVMKKVFLKPNEPMVLYGGTVPIEIKEKETQKEKKEKQKKVEAAVALSAQPAMF